jgi:alkylhydroperoxidase family enzyme
LVAGGRTVTDAVHAKGRALHWSPWHEAEPISPAALNPKQKALYDDTRGGIATGFAGFRTERSDGTMTGPWNASLHHPDIGRASWDLTKAMSAMGVLPANVKEVAILVVGGHFRAAYEIYAHVAAAEQAGMPLARVAALVANLKPHDLAPDEAVAFDVAYQLCRGGPLPEPTWRLAVATFGNLGAAQLVYLVGVYSLLSMTINGFDIPSEAP